MQLPIIKNYWKKSSRLPSIFTLFFFLLSVPADFFVACTFCGTLVGAAVATGAFVAFVLFLFFFFFGVAVFFGFLDASGRMVSSAPAVFSGSAAPLAFAGSSVTVPSASPETAPSTVFFGRSAVTAGYCGLPARSGITFHAIRSTMPTITAALSTTVRIVLLRFLLAR